MTAPVVEASYGFPYKFPFVLGPVYRIEAPAEIVVSFPAELKRGISSSGSLFVLPTLPAAILRNTEAATSTAATVSFPIAIRRNTNSEGSLFAASEIFANALVVKYLDPFGISVVASLSSTALRKVKSSTSLSILVSTSGGASVEHLKAGFFMPFFYAGSSFVDL